MAILYSKGNKNIKWRLSQLKKKNLKEFLNGKSFYFTLALCFAVIIVCAGVITVRNTNQINNSSDYAEIDDYIPEIEPAVANDEPTTVNILDNNDIGVGIAEKESLYEQNQIIESTDSTESSTSSEDIVAQTESTEASIAQNESIETQQEVAQQETPVVKEIFLSFDADDSKMQWPVQGQIVMDFSKEHTIYDKTLEQYRVNNSISIATQAGTAVKAAAKGTVLSITNDNKKGYTLVLDHGNGWQTTYSQLEENIPVKQNDIVEAGDVIGGVANPSKYSVALGSHLDFTVTKDGEAVDPKSMLDD